MNKINFLLLALIFTFIMACNGNGERRATHAETTEESFWDHDISDDQRELHEIVVRSTGNTFQDMDYDTDIIRVSPHHRVSLTLINEASDPSMIHNIVFVRRGKMEEVYNKGIEAGAKHWYVPEDNPHVIAFSELINPGEETTFEFNAPRKGEYEFVCTYPGHWQMMNGKLIVE